MKIVHMIGYDETYRITEDEYEILKKAVSGSGLFEIKRLGVLLNPKAISRVEDDNKTSMFIDDGDTYREVYRTTQKNNFAYKDKNGEIQSFDAGEKKIFKEDQVLAEAYADVVAQLKTPGKPEQIGPAGKVKPYWPEKES